MLYLSGGHLLGSSLSLQECPPPEVPPFFLLPAQEKARVGDPDEVAEEADPVAGEPRGVAFPDQHHPRPPRREPAQRGKATPEDPARLREGDVGVRERLRQAEDDRDPCPRAVEGGAKPPRQERLHLVAREGAGDENAGEHLPAASPPPPPAPPPAAGALGPPPTPPPPPPPRAAGGGGGGPPRPPPAGGLPFR